MLHIRAISDDQITLDAAGRRRRRLKHMGSFTSLKDKDAGILATIESVVAGSSLDNSLEDIKQEPQDIQEEVMYRDGMIWTNKDGSGPPEGFTVVTTESGVMLLRRKRQCRRNLQKLGIGGFLVRARSIRGSGGSKDEDDAQANPTADTVAIPDAAVNPNADPAKPKRRPARRKPKSRLMESYPSYLQVLY